VQRGFVKAEMKLGKAKISTREGRKGLEKEEFHSLFNLSV